MAGEDQELERVISAAVAKSIEKELGSYKVDKEQHYKDHLFLNDLRNWYGDIKSSFWKSLVAALVPALLMLLFVGFAAWVGLKAVAASVIGIAR